MAGSENHSVGDSGGVATAVWSLPKPTLAISTEKPDQDEYEVRIYDNKLQRIVAAIELVSPSNKDRPDHRRAFATKCAALLRDSVSVSIVDLVTDRNANLYAELLESIGQQDPALIPDAPPLYAAACRWIEAGRKWRLETWTHVLTVGSPLPTLPLWLADDLAIKLDLEMTYEQTCAALRIK